MVRNLIEEDRLRVSLVVGVRPEIAARFHQWARETGLEDRLGHGVDVFLAASLDEYFPRFNALLAETDVLWTKPSEMTFFSALGLPLIFSPPEKVHESYNRRWAIENGPGLKQRDPLHAGYWLREWLNEAPWPRRPSMGFYGCRSSGCIR